MPTSKKAAKITTNPMTVAVISLLALLAVVGLPPEKKNINPPTTNIKTAITGTILIKTKSKILSIITKKSQSSQGQPSVPQGTNPSVGQLTPPAKTGEIMKNRNKKLIKNTFFITLF